MSWNVESVISSPTIFGPIAEKLDNFSDKLNIIITELDAFNPAAYTSIKEFVHHFKAVKSDIKRDMSQLATTFKTAQSALNASCAAGSASGAALAMEVIVRFLLEVKDFAKCIIKVGEIISRLAGIIRVIVFKVAQLTKLLVKLAMDAIMKYLEELKANVLVLINDIKTTIVSWVQTDVFDPMLKGAKQNIASLQEKINARKQQLTAAGKDATSIKVDPQILAWQESISLEQALIKELADLGLSSGMFIV